MSERIPGMGDGVPEDFAKLVRRARGPCPGEDLLCSYTRGVLGPKATSVLRSHIELCGICHSWLKRIGEIDRAVALGPDEVSLSLAESESWKAAEPRLRRRICQMAS